MRIIVFIPFLASFWQCLNAQTDSISNNITISLITGSPGEDVYAYFGHTAIRVQDAASGQDVLYSYGTFDFDTPNFYGKFLQGKLLYMLSIDDTPRLFQYYQYTQRGVTEQVLNLNNAQEEQLVQFLAKNYEPANRFYLYDFFYDNCATVIRDVFEKEFKIQYQIDTVRNVTFRQILQEYVEPRDPWTYFGMDLILGIPTDKKADFRNQMFIPDYLSQNLAKATLNGKPLLQPVEILVPVLAVVERKSATLFTPMLVAILLLVTIFIITCTKNWRLKNRFDRILFFILGIAGLFLLFMWFGTDHIATKENWNVLWMNPLYLLLVFGVFRKRETLRRGLLIFYILTLLFVLITWGWFAQSFNIAVIPIIIALIVRCLDRIFRKV